MLVKPFSADSPASAGPNADNTWPQRVRPQSLAAPPVDDGDVTVDDWDETGDDDTRGAGEYTFPVRIEHGIGKLPPGVTSNPPAPMVKR